MLKNQNKELVLLEDLGLLYPTSNSKQKARYGLYKCFCGKEFKVIKAHIKNGNTKSCGCSINKTHGLRSHRLYDTWRNMLKRCNNKNDKSYLDYGGRGVKVCRRWERLENFISDMYPTFKEGLTLDRKNHLGNYEPDNCRWATLNTQAQNTRLLNSTNTSGYRGVSKNGEKWRVRISIDNKSKHLGYFKNPIDGAKAYDRYITDNNLEHTKNF